MNINSFDEIEDEQTEEIKIEKKEMFIAVDGKAFETEEAALEYSKRIIKKDKEKYEAYIKSIIKKDKKEHEAHMKKKAENEEKKNKENRFRNELEDINDISSFIIEIISSKYYELIGEFEKKEHNKKIKKDYENNFNQELLSDIRYKTRVAEIRHYEIMLNDAKQRLDRVVSEIKSEYEAQHPIELEPLSENYTQLKSMFGVENE